VDYLLPHDSMDVSGVDELSNGRANVVGMLYSSNDLYQYPTYPSDDHDAFNIGFQFNYDYSENGATVMDVPMLIS